MENNVIITKLSQYGTVLEGSMKRGEIRDTEIENGLRYVNLTNLDAETTIPTTCNIGRFEIRLICDQNRSAVKKSTGVRRCYRCLSTGHMKHECDNDVVCNYCGQTGHVRRDCDDYKELELGEPLQELHSPQHTHQAEGDNDAASVISNHDVPPLEDCKSVILGASLVKNMGFDDTTLLVSKSGTSASEVDDLLQIAEAKIEVEDVEKVLVHLGTNDLMKSHGDVDAVKLNMVEAVGKVRGVFPTAHIGIAAIPPRKGKSANVNKYNNDARSVNHYVKALTERDTNMQFLDTTKIFAPGGDHVVKRLYSDRDSSGVHFSAEGITELQREIEAFLAAQDSRKRQRSDNETPSSSEKMTKKGKDNAAS